MTRVSSDTLVRSTPPPSGPAEAAAHARPEAASLPVSSEEQAWKPARGGLLALTDQGLVSGTNFLTTILIGRFAGQEALGYYSLGFTFLVFILCLQESLVLSPFIVFGARMRGEERREYSGRVTVQHLALLLLSAALFFAIGIVAWASDSPAAWTGVLFILALTVPLALVRDFHRRMAFADLRMGTAVVLDGTTSVVQLAGLVLLALLGVLSAVTAHGMVAVACAVAGMTAVIMTWQTLHVRTRGSLKVLGDNWSFGKWLVAGQMNGVAHGFVLYWLLGLLAGSSATGAFSACMSVVMLSNPLILGMSNFIGPGLAHAYAQGSRPAVLRIVGKSTLIVAGLLSLFSVFLIVFGDTLLGLLYGAEYTGNQATLTWLALAVLAGSLTIVADHGLRSMERPGLSFACGMAGTITTLVMAVVLVRTHGMAGAACGYCLGMVVNSGLHGLAFLHVVQGKEAGA